MNHSPESSAPGAGAVEQNKGLLDKGRERRERAAQNVEKAKSKISGWWNRAKAAFGSGAEKLSAAAFATPDAVVAGYEATEKKIDQFEDAVVAGADYANKKIDQGVDAIDRKVTQASEWANEKVEQGKDVAKIAALVTVGMAYAAKEEVKEQISAAKEKVKSGWGRLMEFGAKSVENAQNKIRSLQEAAQNKINQVKLSAAKTKLEMLASIKNSVDQAVESSQQSVEEKQAKIVNLEGKINLQNNLMEQAA